MRSLLRASCLLTALSGCQPTPKSVSASTSALGAISSSGKIPITSHSRDAVALYVRARALNENLQPHEAYAIFQQAVVLDPAFALGHYGLASTAPTAKQVRDHLAKAIELSSNASEGERLLILAMRARLDGEPIAVRQIAESLARRFPKDERAHWVLGNACSAQQMYDKAVEHFQQAIAINPQFSLAYNSIGYAYRPTGDMAAAEKAFQQYIALVPNDPNPYDSYAELLMKLGRFDESIAQYNKAQLIDPHFSGSFVGIAADHLFAGRHVDALAEANRYLSVARDDHERRAALLTRALVQVDNGSTDDALRSMDRMYNLALVIGDTASMADDAIAIGDILLDAGRVAAAHSRYRRSHELTAASSLSASVKQDGDLVQHFNLSRVALAMHDMPAAAVEAAEFARGADARRHGDRIRQAHELNGLVALEARDYDRGLAEFALADRQNPSVLSAMASAHLGKGDRAKAEAMQQSALEMYTLPTLPYVFVRAKARANLRARSTSTGAAVP